MSSYCRHLNPDMGTVRRSFTMQVILCPLSCFGITVSCCPLSNFNAVTLPNLQNNHNSEVVAALIQTVPMFGSVLTELQRRGSPRLLHRDSSVVVSALGRPEFIIVYFISLQPCINSNLDLYLYNVITNLYSTHFTFISSFLITLF